MRQLADELARKGYKIGRQKVAHLLGELDYSLQANRKVKEGGHEDRNAQFEFIYRTLNAFQERGQPVVSVDTKKKERVGEFKNGGRREWQPAGQPETVQVHDFMDANLGKAIPHGVYDLKANNGWVSVGTDHDTAEFAVEALRRWWYKMGRSAYPEASYLLVSADGGGSNSSRGRLWKLALQGLADETGLIICVCHFPPGTSKWNKIEHRMFSHISMNWRGRPLTSHAVIVNLIANTRTRKGLSIRAELDTGSYPRGRVVSEPRVRPNSPRTRPFHGEWNYKILPSEKIARS